MRERITLLEKSTTRDAIGGEVITWVEQDEVWAEATPIVGREYFAAQQAEAEADIRFRIRFRDDLDSTWRVEWRDQQYDIVAPPADIDSRKLTTELTCRSVPNT